MSFENNNDIIEINIKNINNKYDVYLNKCISSYNNFINVYEGKNLLTKEKIIIDIYNHDIILLAKRLKNNIIKLNHPNIINIIDIIIESNKIYIIKPYLKQLNINDINDNNNMFIFKQIYRGVKFLFDKNINIEPINFNNIYINYDKDNIIIQLSCIFSPYKTQRKILYGSPLLHSPSELINNTDKIEDNKEKDILYNLGTILYTLLYKDTYDINNNLLNNIIDSDNDILCFLLNINSNIDINSKSKFLSINNYLNIKNTNIICNNKMNKINYTSDDIFVIEL